MVVIAAMQNLLYIMAQLRCRRPYTITASVSSPRREVRAVGMVEHQRADAGCRVHHHAFGELHADVFGTQQFPHRQLVVQVGAGGVAEAVTLPAIARREALLHGHRGRIGEPPILADAAVQPSSGSGLG
jgi:hypothetical protein